MADNVGSGEANGAETIDTFQLTHCIGEAAHPVAARNVDLPWVSANDHAAILAEAGKKHLHLFARGVLRFIEDDEGVGQCASAHEGDRRNLDLTGSQPPLNLFGRHAVVKRVVERTQIGIDFFLHIAGQEAELFTGFHRRPGQDQALDAAIDQLRHRLRHCEIGLACSCRAESEDDIVAHQAAHVGCLHCAARHDRLAPRADHDRRPAFAIARFGIDDPIESRFVGHCDQGLDRACIEVLTDRQLVVHAFQHISCTGHAVFRPFDMKLIAARRDEYAQAVLDLYQIGIELPEQGA